MNGSLPFVKVQSLGNDFVLVHLDEVDQNALPQLARETSDRRFAIGSDGLLVIGPEGDGLRLRMFNTDGSEDFCGNGIRCAALYGFRKGWSGVETSIHHFGETVSTTILDDGRVRSVFPPPDYRPEAVPMAREGELFMAPIEVLGETLTLSAVTTGSTHTVILADRLPDDAEFFRIGPAIEHHPLFPERTSVIWAVPEDGDRIRIRIWERGVGETQGCGTGSAAAAAVYARHSGRASLYCLINPGGEVQVSVKDSVTPIITSASAEILYAGCL